MKKIFIFVFFITIFEISYAENKIAYIDINFILNNSIAGQSITEHIKKIKDDKVNQFRLTEQKLSKKEQDLIKKKNIIDKDEFDKEVKILKEEIDKYRKEKKIFNDEIDKKKIKYTKIILNSLNPIISKYVEVNSITIVLPKKSIVIAKKDLNITNQVMDLLNSQLTKIDF